MPPCHHANASPSPPPPSTCAAANSAGYLPTNHYYHHRHRHRYRHRHHHPPRTHPRTTTHHAPPPPSTATTSTTTVLRTLGGEAGVIVGDDGDLNLEVLVTPPTEGCTADGDAGSNGGGGGGASEAAQPPATSPPPPTPTPPPTPPPPPKVALEGNVDLLLIVLDGTASGNWEAEAAQLVAQLGGGKRGKELMIVSGWVRKFCAVLHTYELHGSNLTLARPPSLEASPR